MIVIYTCETRMFTGISVTLDSSSGQLGPEYLEKDEQSFSDLRVCGQFSFLRDISNFLLSFASEGSEVLQQKNSTVLHIDDAEAEAVTEAYEAIGEFLRLFTDFCKRIGALASEGKVADLSYLSTVKVLQCLLMLTRKNVNDKEKLQMLLSEKAIELYQLKDLDLSLEECLAFIQPTKTKTAKPRL